MIALNGFQLSNRSRNCSRDVGVLKSGKREPVGKPMTEQRLCTRETVGSRARGGEKKRDGMRKRVMSGYYSCLINY